MREQSQLVKFNSAELAYFDCIDWCLANSVWFFSSFNLFFLSLLVWLVKWEWRLISLTWSYWVFFPLHIKYHILDSLFLKKGLHLQNSASVIVVNLNNLYFVWFVFSTSPVQFIPSFQTCQVQAELKRHPEDQVSEQQNSTGVTRHNTTSLQTNYFL